MHISIQSIRQVPKEIVAQCAYNCIDAIMGYPYVKAYRGAMLNTLNQGFACIFLQRLLLQKCDMNTQQTAKWYPPIYDHI